MFRFIGGPARCGKSTLTHLAAQQYRGQLISLDNLRHSYIALASPENYTRLTSSAKIEDHTASGWLKLLRKRDQTIWFGTKAYLSAATELHDDVMMEGCIWPDYVSELDVDYRAVFLVDTSPAHVDRVLGAAHSDKTRNNWMGNRSDEWLTKWAEYNIERSKLYVQLAHEHQQPVFDVADGGFDQAQAAALCSLFAP